MKAPHAEDALPEMVDFFKALADPARLRIVGLLAGERRCGQELAAELSLAPATVTHHLRKLRTAGLVREERQPPYTFYSLDLARMREVLRRTLRTDAVRELAQPADGPKERTRVLRAFFDGERLLQIPAQRKKKEIVFEELLRRLPEDREYSEKELSHWLRGFHSDFCTIRREFIMGGYMERSEGTYRLSARGRAVRSGR